METKTIRLANPGARRMTPAQKAWFSKSPATRSKYRKEVYGKRAADELAKGGRKRRSNAPKKRLPAARYRPASPQRRREAAKAPARRHRRNVASIVRVEPVRRRANAGSVAVYTPRPRRRNAGFALPGRMGQAASVVAGGVATKLIMDNLVPPGMRVGLFGYLTSAIVSTAQGWAAGKVLGKRVGDDMALGGWVYTALRIAQDIMPPFAAFVNPFGGVGEIVESSFPMPPVTYPGDLNRYYIPRDTRDYVARSIREAHFDSMVGNSQTINGSGVGPRDANGGVVSMEMAEPESEANGMGSYGGASPGAWAA